MTTKTTTHPTALGDLIGKRILVELEDGDGYIGVVDHVAGNLVTLVDYSAWYEDASEPYNSPYPDDAVTIAVGAKDKVAVQ